MGLIDRVRASAEQATSGARETLAETELRHELSRAYADLGRTTYSLLEHGTLTDARLAGGADRVRDLETDLAALARPAEHGGDKSADT